MRGLRASRPLGLARNEDKRYPSREFEKPLLIIDEQGEAGEQDDHEAEKHIGP